VKNSINVWRQLIAELSAHGRITPGQALDGFEQSLLGLRADQAGQSSDGESLVQSIARIRQQADTVRACAALQRAEAAVAAGEGGIAQLSARRAWQRMQHK